MEFQRIAIVQSKKYKDASESICKCLIKSLKQRGFTLNQIFIFKVFDIEDLPLAVKTLAKVEKPAPFTSIIAVGVLVKPASRGKISVQNFLKSSLMKISLNFDIHIRDGIVTVDSVPSKKSCWKKLANNTTKSIQTSNELIKSLTSHL